MAFLQVYITVGPLHFTITSTLSSLIIELDHYYKVLVHLQMHCTHKAGEEGVRKHFKTCTDCSEMRVVNIREHSWREQMTGS